MAKILLAEDEQNIASFIRRGLQEFGHEVQVVHDGGTAWSMLQEGVFDLLVLDVIMPKMDGLEVCRQFRLKEGYHTPVIILTALGTTEDIVKGLDAGADDYITKPFGMMEFLARVKAVLRRSGQKQGEKELHCGSLTILVERHEVQENGRLVELTLKEFEVLKYLVENKGIVLTRDQLLGHVWGYDFDGETRTVDVHIRSLRQKLGDAGALIETVRGVGYRIGELK